MSRDADTDRMPLDGLLQPDISLPSRCFGQVHALHDRERRLRLAVLNDAIRYFQRYLDSNDRCERALYEDAVDWFASPDRAEPFSFENVCDALELDAEHIRKGLYRWRRAAQAPIEGRPLRGETKCANTLPRRRLRRHLRSA